MFRKVKKKPGVELTKRTRINQQNLDEEDDSDEKE